MRLKEVLRDMNIESELTWSYFIGIASSLTPLIIYKLYAYFSSTYPLKKLWKDYISKETYGILSCSDLVLDIDSLSTGLYDTLSLSEIRSLLSSFPKTKLHTYSSKRFPPFLDQNNIILFGGPISNAITKGIMVEQRRTLLRFQDHAIINTKNNKRFEPEIRDNKVTKDYGVVIQMKSPFNSNLNLMIIAGCYDYGTYLAGKTLTNPECVKAILENVEAEYFEIVVSGQIVEGTPQTPILEDYILRREDADE